MKNNKLAVCPFCKRKIKIGIFDDEGNLHGNGYEMNPWNGLQFGIMHSHDDSPDCPIVTSENDEPIGDWLYPSREVLAAAWNTRLG